MINMMMMHISLIIIIIALVAEEPGGLSVPGLSLMLQLLVSRDGKVTDDISIGEGSTISTSLQSLVCRI